MDIAVEAVRGYRTKCKGTSGRTMIELSLKNHEGRDYRLHEQFYKHAATVLLPFRGHW